MLTHRLPYAPNRGDRRRSYYIIRHLSARHEVHVVSLVHDEEEAAHVPDMSGFTASVAVAPRARLRGAIAGALALAGSRPLTHVLLDGPTLSRVVADAAVRVRSDVVLAYGSAMARLALEPPLAGTPLVMDFIDVDSAKWRDYARESRWPLSWVYRREARVLGAFEAAAARAARVSFVVNDRELAELRALAPDARTMSLPNGIDLDHFRPPAGNVRVPDRVLFCGVMNYRPNDEGARWFIREVWPRVRAARPGATLCIAGTAPTAALGAAARAAEGIEVTGHLDDVRPAYWAASLFVAPLHLARGVQNKVLDAAAAGLPSVVTSAVAEGLPRAIREACLTADSAEDFASCVMAGLSYTPRDRQALADCIDLTPMNWSARLSALDEVLAYCQKSGHGELAATPPAERRMGGVQ